MAAFPEKSHVTKERFAKPVTSSAARTTRFRDVCGSIDELKRVLHEEPRAAATQPDALESLVEDALFMLGRMDSRRAEYEVFRLRVAAITAALQQLTGPDISTATAEAAALRPLLRAGRLLTAPERDAAIARAEAIRDVAQDIENTINRYKALALELERAYRAVKGTRVWVVDESEAEAAAAQLGEPEWARWLPPSPHRERIMRWLATGRAHLLPAEDGASLADGPPRIQFQDGGVMALPTVRWSDEVRTFYSADRSSDSPPDPRGRLYREYEGRRVHPIPAEAPPAVAQPARDGQ